jgi:HAE1 family hydrophobic/amphiphilic exporter-1
MRQPGTNTVEIVDRVNALLPQLRAQLPPAVALDVFYDRSESIRESVNDVKRTLVLSVILVVMVIFIFLRNVSATIIPSLALPIVGTFVHVARGFTVDNLSLTALRSRSDSGRRRHVVLKTWRQQMGKPRRAALEGGTKSRLPCYR